MRRTSIALCPAVLCALALPAPAAARPTDANAGALSQRLDALAAKGLRSAPPAEQADALSLPAEGPGSLIRDGGRLSVDIRTSGSAPGAVSDLRDAGADVENVSRPYRTVTSLARERDLRQIAAVEGVESVQENLAPIVWASGDAAAAANPISSAFPTCAPGPFVSEGDAQLKATLARDAFHVSGQGQRVGVLSDSFDRDPTATTDQAADIASGDLPGAGNPCGRTEPVQVIDDAGPGPDSDYSDEGRAMAHIVHDLAPDARLAFATAFTSDLAFADNIRSLAAQGSDVIVDDISYFNEPFFQDGPISVAVNEVTAAGVPYFSSAGNTNEIVGGNDLAAWEAPTYREVVCPTAFAGAGHAGLNATDSCMDFDPSGVTDNTLGFSVGAGQTLSIDLQWAEPRQGVTTDIDMVLIDNVNQIVAQSSDDNPNVTEEAFEFLSVSNGGPVAAPVRLVINNFTDAGTPRLKFILLDQSPPTEHLLAGEFSGASIFGHNGAENTISTGAVRFSNPDQLETFSSRGPVTLRFGPADGVNPAATLGVPQVLAKPDISATDGNQNSFFGSGGAPFRFFGTSAAAPHAAAVAALQLDGNPGLTPAQVRAAQTSTADPVGAFGPKAGAGLVDASLAVKQQILPPDIGFGQSQGQTGSNPQPALAFSADQPATFTCSLDGAAAAACSSPFTPPAPLADAAHSLQVAATNPTSGLTGTETLAFTVDAVPNAGPPGATVIGAHPKRKARKRRARFTFTASGVVAFQCKIDTAAYAPCSSPHSIRVRPGKHNFRARGLDAAGNPGPADSFKWRVRR